METSRSRIAAGRWQKLQPRASAALGALAAAVLVAGAAPARAAAWNCWLHQGDQLACMSLADAHGPSARAARSTQGELMRLIRQRPGALRGQMVFIPMHTMPFDDSPVVQLADAVLCGTAPRGACRVRYERDPGRLDPEARRALADAHDPVLAR